jgi:hypothetical protein
MKKALVFFIVVFIVLAFATTAFAHPHGIGADILMKLFYQYH